MRRWAIIGLVGFVGVTGAGFTATYILKMRRAADHVGCANQLREIGLFAAHHADPNQPDPTKVPLEIPAGTVALPGVAPDDRLSWFPRVLPGLDQRRQSTAELVAGIRPLEPFASEANQAAARFRLRGVFCPGNVPATDPATPSPTCFVGIAGVGSGALDRIVTDMGDGGASRFGCFSYGEPTPFARITDGLSQTIMLGERSGDLGPWLRGGPATVRYLDDRPDAPLLVGTGGQFGGNHATGANWGFADGSVRFLTGRADPRVLYGLATIAGREADVLPGD